MWIQGNNEIGKYRNMKTWKQGNMKIGKYGNMEYRNMEILIYRNTEI